jgi:antitoxin VapB
MVRSTVFSDNKSQAVRLPKAVAFPDAVKRVDIVKLGQARLITPAGTAWDSFFDGPSATVDFMTDRDQPEDQERA